MWSRSVYMKMVVVDQFVTLVCLKCEIYSTVSSVFYSHIPSDSP